MSQPLGNLDRFRVYEDDEELDTPGDAWERPQPQPLVFVLLALLAVALAAAVSVWLCRSASADSLADRAAKVCESMYDSAVQSGAHTIPKADWLANCVSDTEKLYATPQGQRL